MKHLDTPRIYVACLAAYNSGTLHGKWIECDQTASEIRGEIKQILKDSPEPNAEEWAIHDYENFGSLRLSEYECLDDIAAFTEAYEKWGELLADLVNHCGGLSQLEEALRVLEEDYAGEARSVEEWAESFLEETGQLESIPDNLRYYFDFEKFANDLELSGDIFSIETDSGVHIFWNH